MGSLRAVSVDASQRARRWDAIVLGSGVAALVAAARLGMREQRVLVVEEQAATDLPSCLREPFLAASAASGSVLASVLHELRVPLIDRRRFQPEALAYQVVGPDLRLDVGEAELTASELAVWDLAAPDAARALVEALDRAAETERELLMSAPLLRSPGLRSFGRRSGSAASAGSQRGLPRELADAGPALGRVLAAQIRGLGNHALGGPTGEACTRLLGAPLRGGVTLEHGSSGLLPVLRRRIEALYGEFRTVRSGFELVSVNGLPGVALEDTGEIWLGRALVAGCSPAALARALGNPEVARQLGAPAATLQRRERIHWRAPRADLPEGMAARLILLTQPESEDPQRGVASLTVSSTGPRSRMVDLVARVVVGSDEQADDCCERVETALRELMPFAGDALERQTVALPSWDDDDWLEHPAGGAEWPGEAQLRVSSRPPVYRLDRPAVAGLGLEGDLLLGWRAGDAISTELA